MTERVKAVGYGSHHVNIWKDAPLADDLTSKTIFQEAMAEQGVLTIGSNNTCFSHTQGDVDRILAAYRIALTRVKEGAPIRGTKLQPVFRKP